jgi:hypothetical protein
MISWFVVTGHGLLAIEKAAFHGDSDRVGAIIRSKFGKNALHVSFHCGLGDVELRGDDLIGVARCNSP